MRNTVIPTGAIAQSCAVSEKYFKIRNLTGRNNKFALEPKEIEEMCSNTLDVEATINDKALDFQSTKKCILQTYSGRREKHDYQK